MATIAASTVAARQKRGLPLLGNFEENALNGRLIPSRTVSGYSTQLRASGKFRRPTLSSEARAQFFIAGDGCFPYVTKAQIGYFKIPKRGSLQVALFNPMGTCVRLFLVPYDLSDMPPNSRTILRQKTFLITNAEAAETTATKNPEEAGTKPEMGRMVSSAVNINKTDINIPSIPYIIQLSVVSSNSGKIYLHKELCMVISKKIDLETATQLTSKSDSPSVELRSVDEMPKNPRYFSR